VALIRLNADGSLDSNFGSGGIVNVAGGQGYAIAIQGDGKIVVGGSMNVSSTVTSMAAWRFNADGSLDSSFGSGGQATLSFGRNISSRALAIATQKVPIFGGTEQRILLGGWHDGKTADDFALARLDAAGQTDASFGSGGAVSKDFFGNTDTIRSVQVDSQNRILVAGSALKPGTKNGTSFTDFALVRYGVNGAVDPSFGSSGSVVTQVSGSTNTLAGAVIQVNGNIVAAGRTSLGLTLVRYTSTGAPDASFGVNGVAAANFLDLGATGMSAAGVVLQQDGKILAIGTATTPPGSTVCLSRFYP